jgi:hypothetical protein
LFKCPFCCSRFKKKHEAKRHKKSLHLQPHWWSCAAISGHNAAFHLLTLPKSQTPNGPSGDACGYYGEEFSNSPHDWNARIEYLTAVHGFGKYNQTKKFFRVDHFRQHLKHSHAGTSGKWTDMLEKACVTDKPPVEVSAETIIEVGGPSQQLYKKSSSTLAQPATEESQLEL